MIEFRTTRAGVQERIGETKWCSPAHLVTYEIETKRGVQRRSMPRVRSPSIFGGHIKGLLTDRQIAKYCKEGFYLARHAFMSERKKEKSIQKLLPRLVYDCDRQNFVTVFA